MINNPANYVLPISTGVAVMSGVWHLTNNGVWQNIDISALGADVRAGEVHFIDDTNLGHGMVGIRGDGETANPKIDFDHGGIAHSSVTFICPIPPSGIIEGFTTANFATLDIWIGRVWKI